MDAFDYQGLWWIAERADDEVAGILSYSPGEGLYLRLIGAFADEAGVLASMDSPETYTILGMCNDSGVGKFVSLRDCSCTNCQHAIPGFARQTFRANLAFFGTDWVADGPPVFSSVEVQYTYLAEWADRGKFDMKYVRDEEGRLEKCEITYGSPPDITLPQNKGNIVLRPKQRFQQDVDGLTIHQSAAFFITAAEPTALSSWYDQWLSPLESFLDLNPYARSCDSFLFLG